MDRAVISFSPQREFPPGCSFISRRTKSVKTFFVKSPCGTQARHSTTYNHDGVFHNVRRLRESGPDRGVDDPSGMNPFTNEPAMGRSPLIDRPNQGRACRLQEFAREVFND